MRRVKIVISILKNCLVNHDRFKRHILCFELKTVEKYDVLKRGFSKRLEAKATWKKIWEDKGQKLYIAAYVDGSWEKEKRMCLYSTDTTAYTQHKHDKHYLQSKTQKPADKYFRKARETRSDFVALVIVLRFLLVRLLFS